MARPEISYDRQGIPGIWAGAPAAAFWGIGWLHGRHRGMQTLLLHAGGRGCLAQHLLPSRQLVDMDALAHRLDLPARGEAEARQLSGPAAEWLDAYLDGVHHGLRAGGVPFELRTLLTNLPHPTRASTIAGLLLAAYLGLAGGQERMERALVEALQRGANPETLKHMFSPHLEGLEPRRLQTVASRPALGFGGHAFVGAGGSNAWAVQGERSSSDTPLLCGDPHLQINQLPALFFEVRARVRDDYWLGATIPGLPGVAVGRNRTVAWSGTFAVADNVDFWVESQAERRGGVERRVRLQRRWRRPLELRFFTTRRGVVEPASVDSEALASRWAGAEKVADAMWAYMKLPQASSVSEAECILEHAHTMSLHWVLADRAGRVRYKQAGRIPKRPHGWSGLYPVASRDAEWLGFYEGEALPTAEPEDGIVASANEARLSPDDTYLATLAQPDYRRQRIREVLAAHQRHDVRSMQRLQLDVMSLQARRLVPLLLEHLPHSALRQALVSWDGRYNVDSRGAHAFRVARDAAVDALAPELGGAWFRWMLRHTELRVWWLQGLDRLLLAPESWRGERGQRLSRALHACTRTEPMAWGDYQRLHLRHMIFGGLPRFLGLDRDGGALPGSPATVRQGNVFEVDGGPMAVGPAYRWVVDLGDAGAWSALPGGVDATPSSRSYAAFLFAWRQGDYHRLEPPRADEPRVDVNASKPSRRPAW